MTNIPPMAWVILALGVLWLVLRYWQNRQNELRAEARDARIAELLAEREKMAPGDEPPSSLGAVVSPPADAPSPEKEKRCLGCRTVNPADAKTCAGCGLEL